jgi:hypothetical protein
MRGPTSLRSRAGLRTDEVPGRASRPCLLRVARGASLGVIALAFLLSVQHLSGQQPSGTPNTSRTPAPTSPPQTHTAPAPAANTPAATTKAAPLTIEQIRRDFPNTAPADRFEYLRRHRKDTLEAIDETALQLKALNATIDSWEKQKDILDGTDLSGPTDPTEKTQADLQRAKADVAELQQKVEAAKKSPTTGPDPLSKLEFILRDRQTYLAEVEKALTEQEQRKKEDEKRTEELEGKKKAAEDELTRLNDEKDKTTQAQLSYQRALGEIDDMVNQLFIASDATNSFKLKMSIILSLLIAGVIAGFFFVAWSDEEVKRKIFSNEAGIQFITLFAIVISVILFGIIGVLESKELSALLGGLSGYILGRKA